MGAKEFWRGRRSVSGCDGGGIVVMIGMCGLRGWWCASWAESVADL
jgi:hypothetical protein